MEKTTKQKMLESLEAFGRLFQLPPPPIEYFETLRAALHNYGWKLSDFNAALNMLVKDEKYTETARFGKYPLISDYLRVKQISKSKLFYEALSAYLSGCWWEKDNILALATPAQENALMMAGGLSGLYQRATSDIATPVYKLIDIVTERESEAPTERIDMEHRIGAPTSMKQIINTIKRENNVNSEKTQTTY